MLSPETRCPILDTRYPILDTLSLYLKMQYRVLCIVLFSFSTITAQPALRFWHLNNSNGLSGTSVKTIIQDQKGFIWIGTDFGLCRYDSKNIISFKNIKNDSTSISGNTIKRIIEDKSGLQWIVTDGGLCSFNSSTQIFTRYPLFEKNEKIKSVNDLLIDSKNNFWIATDENGWGKLDVLNKKYLRENFDDQNQLTAALKKIYAVQALSEDRNGIMYFGTRAFSLIVKKDTNYLFSIGNRNSYPYPAHTISTIFCDSKNRIWIGAWDNVLHQYDVEKNILNPIFLDANKIIDKMLSGKKMSDPTYKYYGMKREDILAQWDANGKMRLKKALVCTKILNFFTII